MQVSRSEFKIKNGMLIALFAFMVMAFSPGQAVFAADADSLRIGGDYKFLTLREGARFQECQRACKNDVSCKAWTFIKQRTRKKEGLNFNLGPDLNIGFGGREEVIPPQCRLKHTVGPKHSNECCTSGVKRIVQRARPSKAERCADYAETAIEQQDKNLSQRCRNRGTRWHGNYRKHYRWCMDVSPRSRRRETAARTDALRECRDNRRVRNRRCDRYASTAMDILQQAKENDCRSSDAGWDDEHERVYEWCLDRGPAERTRVLERAQKKLAACIRRGGGARVERCETYADGALEQVDRAKKNSCRTSGTTWATDYRTHYRACRKSNRREMRKKTQVREDYINRCIRRASQARVVETGSVEVRQRNARQWHTVRFTKRFKDPVVIMGAVSFNGGDPAHARVRRVTPRGFEFRIEEFGKDGAHARETLSYMAVEKGIHELDGSVIEAGTINTGADLVNRDWSRVRLSSRWRKAPVVLAQTQTFKGADPVNARIKEVTQRNFKVSLSEQESDRRGHARETIAFVAITQGRHQIEGEHDANAHLWSGRVSRANHRWSKVGFPRRFAEKPALFATAQSSNGADTFVVRYRALRLRGAEMRLQEEQSKDRETNHTNEVLGVVALPYGSYWARSSKPVRDQVADDRGAPPVVPVQPDTDLANCRDYSDRAVRQHRRATRLDCGFEGRQWHGNENRHVRWCRRNGLGAASDKLENHRVSLQQCKRRADARPPAPRTVDVDWKRIDGRLKHVSAGSDGTVWGVGPRGKVWERRRGGWRKKRGRIKQLDVGSRGEIWAVGTDDSIFRWGGRRGWRKVKGLLKHISVGSDGAVWGVNSRDRIYRWNGSSWSKVGGSLKQISVGNRNTIWGVNRNESVYSWNGRRWVAMPGKMSKVSVSKNGSVFGISSDDKVYQWNARRSQWNELSGRLKQISVGRNGDLWGVNINNRVFRANVR